MVDQKKEAMDLAQQRANESGYGYYVYKEIDDVGIGVATYHVTRDDLEQPKNTELVAYVIPQE